MRCEVNKGSNKTNLSFWKVQTMPTEIVIAILKINDIKIKITDKSANILFTFRNSLNYEVLVFRLVRFFIRKVRFLKVIIIDL